MLARKGEGKEAKLSYSGNLLVENRNGLIVNAMVWEASGTAERDTALAMLEQIAGTKRVTVGGDKGFDTADFIAECRHMQVTPHVAQNDGRRGGSAIDQRTTRHAGYRISQKKRKRIEECFGWLKTIALLRKVRHHGLFKVDWVFTFACAVYNLVPPAQPVNTGGVSHGRSVFAACKKLQQIVEIRRTELSPLSLDNRSGPQFAQIRGFSAAC